MKSSNRRHQGFTAMHRGLLLKGIQPAVVVLGLLLSGTGAIAQGAQGVFEGTGDLTIDKPADKVDITSTPAPEGALVLFGGHEADLVNWVALDGKSPVQWVFTHDAMQVNGGNILSKEQFTGHFKLHVEFRIPYLPDRKGQDRGNSGVYVQGRYEVQVLDAYHNDTYKDGMCAAIYGIDPPSENVAKAPTVWQSYDIDFTSPQYENGKKTELGTMTVWWNGVKVHDKTKLTKDCTTSGRETDPSTPGPIMLQDHGSPDQFRNIWLLPLK